MTNKEAIERLKWAKLRIDNATYSPETLEALDLAIKALEGRPQGEWIDYSNEGYVECPFCGSATNCEDNKDELHYCWNCGAEMRQEETTDE